MAALSLEAVERVRADGFGTAARRVAAGSQKIVRLSGAVREGLRAAAVRRAAPEAAR